MRRVIAVVTLMMLALPATAAECSTGSIDWVENTPHLTRETTGDGVRYDIVGQFVNYQTNDGDLASEQVPDLAAGVTVCPSSVTFTLAERRVEQPQPNMADVDADTWNDFVAQTPDAVKKYSAGVYPI